jgi:diguanylate cyclase (GGDEF)-like protein
MFLRFAELLRNSVQEFHLDLRFPPKVEEEFEQEHREERIGHFRISILYAFPLYNAFLLLDYICLRQSFGLSLVARLGIVTPLALLCFALIHRVGRRAREFLFAATPLPGMVSILVLYHGRMDLIAIGQIALILMMLYSMYAMWPDFWYACGFILVVVLGDTVFLMNSRALDYAQTLALISLIWTTAFLSLQASHSMERQMRISYQFRLQLSARNTELLRISNIDSLTGIPNRRYLDNELRAQWRNCLRAGQPISVLMIDLDNFKDLNDRHGHAYGDNVLSLVANALRQALRDNQDIVARYGGEEFVVILPGRLLPSALVIAQRLCDAVRAAALPPDLSGITVHQTISIGVASARPSFGSGSARLLRAADTALYKAKANGRDCVWPEKSRD